MSCPKAAPCYATRRPLPKPRQVHFSPRHPRPAIPASVASTASNAGITYIAGTDVIASTRHPRPRSAPRSHPSSSRCPQPGPSAMINPSAIPFMVSLSNHTPSTHASRVHLPLFSDLSLLSAHSFLTEHIARRRCHSERSAAEPRNLAFRPSPIRNQRPPPKPGHFPPPKWTHSDRNWTHFPRK